jgi:ferric-dicitrate binding protein FerR (iron transport regulator)
MTDDLRDLAERYLAGAATPGEEATLADRLRSDDAAARELLAAARRDVALHTALKAFVEAGPARRASALPRPVRRPRRTLRPLAAAAAILLAAGAATWGLRPEALPPTSARLERAAGGVAVLDRGALAPARAGMAIEPGHELRVPAGGAVLLAYPDGTHVEAGGDAALALAAGTGGDKRLLVTRGTVDASVTPQPAGLPFIITTPQAEATVRGTRLVLRVTPGATHLAVIEGAVRLVRRESGAAVEVTAGGAAVAGAETAAPTLLRPEPARPADEVADAVGVVLHLNRPPTASRFDVLLKPRLLELGVRRVRDGDAVLEPEFRRMIRDLGASGIRATVFMDPACRVSPADAVAAAKDLGTALEAVEGPCTPDIVRDGASAFAYRGLGFPEGVRAYQRDLVDALRADPATASLPVYTPALRGPARARELGPLPADAAAMHSFPFGRLPDDALDTWWIPETRAMAEPGRPLVITSSGWHTAPGALSPHHPQPGISESAASRYVPRLVLEYALRGIRRIFYYDFIDDGEDAPGLEEAEHHFGLLRHDGTPKPSFHALRRLLARLADPGPRLEPGALGLAIVGAPTDLRRLVLRKRDGTFCLVLWRNAASFDAAARRDVDVTPARVTLAVSPVFAAAELYLPSVSEGRVHRVPDPAVFEVEVPDHPLVVELIPAR